MKLSGNDRIVNYDLKIYYEGPAVDLDLYAEPVLEDSRDAFARIRDEAPVVWLPRHGTATGLLVYTRRLDEHRVRPGSWAASVFEARDRGELTTPGARAPCIDFVAPALDTTILASTHLLWVLARNTEAWQRIREEPDAIARAVVENVRLASPIRGFTRTLARGHDVECVPLPAGARVAVLFGAANLDERELHDPERLDPARENKVQLGWGNGAHTCVGIHLARLEMQALLRAMVDRVQAIEVGSPRRLRNNTLQGIAHPPARFIPA